MLSSYSERFGHEHSEVYAELVFGILDQRCGVPDIWVLDEVSASEENEGLALSKTRSGALGWLSAAFRPTTPNKFS